MLPAYILFLEVLYVLVFTYNLKLFSHTNHEADNETEIY